MLGVPYEVLVPIVLVTKFSVIGGVYWWCHRQWKLGKRGRAWWW